jgi:hypothetical protein
LSAVHSAVFPAARTVFPPFFFDGFFRPPRFLSAVFWEPEIRPSGLTVFPIARSF